MNAKILHTEWQNAFAEWHLHRTDECAKVEQERRIDYLNFVRKIRRAKVKSSSDLN